MARIIGPITPDKWERVVRTQLQTQLPSDWTVVSNVCWALKDDNGFVRDGQADFVVLAPNMGMIIVEVKGSRSVRVADDGLWYRQELNRRTGELGREFVLDEAPPEQANRNMHRLAAIVKQELSSSDFPGSYAFVVIYPNGVIKGKSDLYDRSTIITNDEMSNLTLSIKNALIKRGATNHGHKFSADLSERIGKMLSNGSFIVRPADTIQDAIDDRTDIDELTRQQFAALRGAFELQSVAIVGPAGCGKTMLALWKLSALLEEGHKAIYVCFNKALAEYLRSQNNNIASAIISVDSLFAKLSGPPGPNTNIDTTYFQETLPQRVFDIAVDMPTSEKYDAIIIDEGQDLGETRVIALLELLKKNGQWLFFADWKQNLFNSSEKQVLGAEVTFRLHHNCRNTALTNAATNLYCKQSVAAMPGVPVGAHPLVVRCNSANSMAQRAWELVNQLSPQGGAVILSPRKLENSCMANLRLGYGLNLSQDVKDLGKEGFVFFSTIKAFKGLEAQTVILVDVDVPGDNVAFTAEDLYVACTRATGRLALITTSERTHEWYTKALI